MAEVHTLLHMSCEEAQSLRQLAQYAHRVKDVITYLDAQRHQPIEHRPDEIGAQVQALETLFHDVLGVLQTEQKQILLDKWRSQVCEPSWLRQPSQSSPAEIENDVKLQVLNAAIGFLENESRNNGD